MAAKTLVFLALLEGYASSSRMVGLESAQSSTGRVPDQETSAPSPGFAAASSAATSPALGFPLGTALVLFLVFGVSTLFSCCYHWEKIRGHTSRLTGHSAINSSAPSSPGSAAAAAAADRSSGEIADPKPNSKLSRSFPVLMPGDRIPKYVAWPSSPHRYPGEDHAA